MKITRRQLRQIIIESESYKHLLSKDHQFGHPWSGTPHDLAVVQGRTFGGGSVVDLKSYDKMVDTGIAFTNGNAKKNQLKLGSSPRRQNQHIEDVNSDFDKYF